MVGPKCSFFGVFDLAEGGSTATGGAIASSGLGRCLDSDEPWSTLFKRGLYTGYARSLQRIPLLLLLWARSLWPWLR